LQVTALGERVLVRGSAPSYYAKQLALLAVQEVLGSNAGRVVIDIDVGTAEFRAVEGRDAPARP